MVQEVCKRTPGLRDAIALATMAHDGDFKRHEPRIFHVMRVVRAVSRHGEEACIIAALHDVVESKVHPITIQDLRVRGYSDKVVDVIDALSRRTRDNKKEKYSAFIVRVIEAGELAIWVKLADIGDSLRPEYRRPADGLVEDESRITKYRDAQARLLAALQDCLAARSRGPVLEYA